jgi:glycerol-3-phosphate dehydrogenase
MAARDDVPAAIMTRIAVIGAGAVGSAIASALVRAGHAVTLIEARSDVGAGTSKANTAIWHTGFDAKPGTLEARLVARGYQLLAERADEMNWVLERTGAILVAWNEEQFARLGSIIANATAVGYTAVEHLRADEVYAAEPHLGPGALGGLLVPDEGLLDPWSIVIGLATDAVVNGATLLRSAPLTAVESIPDGYLLTTGAGHVEVDWVVNAAGLDSDHVDRMFGEDGFTITPRRGELIVFDKLARRLVDHVILPVPTATTKGVLVSPTVYGNVLLGPTADDIHDRAATGTTQTGLDGLLEKGRAILPELLDEEVTATYAGLRAASEHSDYCYELFPAKHYVRVGGIRSTGISSCLAIAEDVVSQFEELGIRSQPLTNPVSVPMPTLAEDRLRPYADADLIAEDPAYGDIACLCEKVTLGEVRDSLRSPVPAVDIDGVRRRTRAVAGRCQGFHCGARISALVEGRDG